MTISRATTLAVTIHCRPERLFEVAADPSRWPEWAVAHLSCDGRAGTIDHRLGGPGGALRTSARVLANGTGSELVLTVFQPDRMPDEDFDDEVARLEADLAALKRQLEPGWGSR
jgi:uncharacterized protein YndB with AHSA1/START domain